MLACLTPLCFYLATFFRYAGGFVLGMMLNYIRHLVDGARQHGKAVHLGKGNPYFKPPLPCGYM